MAEHVLTLDDRAFEQAVLASSRPVLVDFWAPWCGPCQAMAPVIEALAVEFAGRATVAKLNVDDFPALAVRFGIRTIPTLLFFKDGQVVERLVGVVAKQVLAEKLQALGETP
ncbi:MAG: thioredoxin [Candidatus Tectimicrobiota bacterium]|nr:MAG: thioredoxin [Candidatus Tectomicrobia bacterium]